MIYTEEFPPYNFEVNGKLVGINLDLTEAACKAANITCIFEKYPWKRAMRMAKNHRMSGLISTARTQEREQHFQWVGPFPSSSSCLFKLSHRKDIVITNNEQARQYTLGDSTDMAYTELHQALGFEVGKNLLLYSGKYGALKPFKAGRVEITIMSSFSISQQLKIVGLNIEDVIPLIEIDQRFLNGNYLALNKEVPEPLVKRLQRAYQHISSSDILEKIQAKYMSNVQHSAVDMATSKLWETCAKHQNSIFPSQ